MLTKHAFILDSGPHQQHGAALMVMLVIVIIGAATVLVSSLTSVNTMIQSNDINATSLLQAKQALIGYAIKDTVRPGELPCPDVNNDGQLTLNIDYIGTNCVKLLGRLPWKTLGLADLRDAAGERLWYAVSDPFHANGNAVLNSDTPGTLKVSGNLAADNIVAIIFAPGKTLPGQNRTSVNNSSAYLESIITEPTAYQQQTPNDHTQGNFTYNDQLLMITPEQLFAAIEIRIAREARSCLDDYAAISASKYPWAAPVTDTTGYNGTWGTYFGRLPAMPNNNITGSNSPPVVTLLNAISALQDALDSYSAHNNSNTRNALKNAGVSLESAANSLKHAQPTNPAVPNSITSSANKAGDFAQKLAGGKSSVSGVQAEINTTNNALSNAGITASAADQTMSKAWPSSCNLISSNYWPAWKNLVFYQIAYGYQPDSAANCAGTNCISVNGAGEFRAAVLMARRAIGTENRANTNIITTYLEGGNPHSAQTPSTSFETYDSSNPNYAIVNDQVLCLDGRNSCK